MATAKTVDAYVRGLPDDQQLIISTLRSLIQSAAPQATESLKWAQPVYELNGPFAYIKAHKAHVTFGFWRGVELDGGQGLLETSGSKMAHMKIRSPEDIPAPTIRRLVKAAVKLNRLRGDPSRSG